MHLSIFFLLYLLYAILLALILGNVLISYFPDWRYHRVGALIYSISEPLLAPVRRLIPPIQTGNGQRIDITPAVCLVAAWVVVVVIIQIAR